MRAPVATEGLVRFRPQTEVTSTLPWDPGQCCGQPFNRHERICQQHGTKQNGTPQKRLSLSIAATQIILRFNT